MVVRPYRTEVNKVTMTWKFRDGMFAHFMIEEAGKDPVKPLLLGTRLKIGEREFEDLDEVIAT